MTPGSGAGREARWEALGHRGRLRRLAVLALVPLSAACASAPIRQYDLRDRPLSCDDANRFAYQTLESMGFTIGSFTPATYGRPGAARGRREADERRAEAQDVTVKIGCSAAGATIDASDDRAWIDPVEFKRAFFQAFTNVVAMTEARKELEAKIAAGSAPASQQRHDLQVDIEPLAGQAAKLHLGLDLEAASVLPVSVRMANHTARAYELEPRHIRLRAPDGARVSALTPDEAAERVVAARLPASGEPLTALPAGSIAEKLRAGLFRVRRLDPGAQASGYLYFPLAPYQGARVVLTDVESGEPEGVAVDF